MPWSRSLDSAWKTVVSSLLKIGYIGCTQILAKPMGKGPYLSLAGWVYYFR
jgi:hypothetical protein